MKTAVGNNVVYVKSDRFFNDPDDNKFFDDMGMDVQPVDIYGGLVPQGKSLDNLKKAEKAIRHRFQLDPYDIKQGGEK